MTPPKPTILLVPGLWEGPAVYTQVQTLLHTHAYQTHTTPLPSTGTLSPRAPTMADDIASIRATLTTLVASNADVLLVLHSAGGFLGSEAMQGLSARERREQGLEGGVMGIVFLAAGLAPTGHQHVDLPFFDKVNGPPGGMCCVTPRALLFNDLSSAEAAKWEKELRTQPADGWNGVTAHCGWKDVESTYLVCGQDSVLPEALQLHFAEMAGSRIVRCNAGHMAMLSMPEKVVEVVRGVVEGEVGTFGN